jgi:hypothetical protein
MSDNIQQVPAGFEVRESVQERQERERQSRDAQVAMFQERARQQLAAESMAGHHDEKGIELYAWCGNVLEGCSDEQQTVIGTRHTWNRTYGETDPTADLWIARQIENTFVSFSFDNPEERICETCGANRHISDQKRPVYLARSGHDQRGLIKIAKKFIEGGNSPQGAIAASLAAKPQDDDRVTTLEKELAELKAQIAGRFDEAAEANVEAPEASRAATGGRRGYRERNGRYEAIIYRNESEDGRQRGVGTFDTAEEAIAARKAWLS